MNSVDDETLPKICMGYLYVLLLKLQYIYNTVQLNIIVTCGLLIVGVTIT